MGLKTIPFRDIEDKVGNMYEAVAVMSGQAKVELQERILSKAIMDHQEEEEDLDVFDEVDVFGVLGEQGKSLIAI